MTNLWETHAGLFDDAEQIIVEPENEHPADAIDWDNETLPIEPTHARLERLAVLVVPIIQYALDHDAIGLTSNNSPLYIELIKFLQDLGYLEHDPSFYQSIGGEGFHELRWIYRPTESARSYWIVRTLGKGVRS